MKKGLVFLTLLVFVVSAFSLGFTDVGLDNWAYDYVMKLVEKGIIPVEQPTFRGYEPLTRSDAAVWMSRLITYLENSPEIAKTKDIQYLEAKVNDLSKKLSALESSLAIEQAGATAAVSQEVAQLQSKVAQLESKLSQTESSLKNLNKTVEQDSLIVKGIPALSRKVYDLEQKVDSLEEFQSTMTRNHLNLKYDTYDKIDGLSNRVSDLEASLDDFKTTMTRNYLNLKYETYDKIDNLSNQVSAHDEKIANLENEVADVKSLAEQNAMFVKALPSISMKVYNNEAKIEEISRELEVQKEEIAKAKDHRLLWLTAITGVGLGIIAMCLAEDVF